MNEASSLPIVPYPIGIVNHKGQNKILDVENAMMGNTHARAFAKSLKYQNAEELLLGNNRLTSEGAMDILKSLNLAKVRELNLSDNVLVNTMPEQS